MPVLLIEDDTALQVLITSLLSRKGIAAEIIRRGDLALDALATAKHEAIILDLLLPGMTGFEILEHLYDHEPHLLPRIIVVTAVSESDLVRRFKFGGLIWRLIRKPFDIDELTDAVINCVRCHSRPAERRVGLGKWLEEQTREAGAATASVAGLGQHTELQLLASCGDPTGKFDAFFPLPVRAQIPICSAVRTGRPVWLASVAPSLHDYPILAPLWTKSDRRSIAAIPLKREGHVIGAMGLGFKDPQAFSTAQRQDLLAIAERCSAIAEDATPASGDSYSILPRGA